jgi:hypothetical protein
MGTRVAVTRQEFVDLAGVVEQWLGQNG